MFKNVVKFGGGILALVAIGLMALFIVRFFQHGQDRENWAKQETSESKSGVMR